MYSNMAAEPALDPRVHTVRSSVYPGNPGDAVVG